MSRLSLFSPGLPSRLGRSLLVLWLGLGDGLVPFLGMPAIVQADADDVGGDQRGQQLADLGLFPRVAAGAKQVPLEASGGAIGVLRAEVNAALSVAVADDLHRW